MAPWSHNRHSMALVKLNSLGPSLAWHVWAQLVISGLSVWAWALFCLLYAIIGASGVGIVVKLWGGEVSVASVGHERWQGSFLGLSTKVYTWALDCFRYLFTSSGAWMFSAGSQLLCAVEYPFHLIKYCFFFQHPYVHCPRICSTSYSSSPSIMSGGGSRKFTPCSSVSL